MTAAGADRVTRIAMWSGPRNISTAMMRSFEARGDTAVWDEPFYAAYLTATGLNHPMRGDIVRAGECDPDKVIERLLQEPPRGCRVYYQKHMTQHMLKNISREWIGAVTNCFLIRDPEQVLASYALKRDEVRLADIGFLQQHELFDQVCQREGRAPPVLDAADVLENPERSLRALCARCGVAFSEKMLSWTPGPKPGDGVWGAHWYGAVNRSCGFARPAAKPVHLPAHLMRIADQARPAYEALRGHRLA